MNGKLPPVAVALESIIGRRLTLALASSLGAGMIYVPKRPKPCHKLTQIIGLAATFKLAKTFGGCSIRIPVCDQARKASRNAEIWRLAAEGMTQVQLAQEFDITQRQVRNILRM